MKFLTLLWLSWCFVTLSQNTKTEATIPPTLLDVTIPKVVMYNFKFSIQLTLSNKNANGYSSFDYKILEGSELSSAKTIATGTLEADEKKALPVKASISQGEYLNAYTIDDLGLESKVYQKVWVVLSKDNVNFAEYHGYTHSMPGWVTLLPIIVMLGVALFSSQATIALLLGIFASATFINGFNPLVGFLRTFDYYTINALANPDHAKVIMFTFYLSSAVALIQKSGGAEALASSVTSFATTRWRGQWAAFIIGIIIFIDDLTSCMVVGANMTVVTDRLYLSHEKLAFIVHVTSAPLTSLSPISSWIGFTLGLIATQFQVLKIDKEPFLFFLSTIPSRFFPILAIVFCALCMILRRDFGIMLDAERRAYFNKVVVESDSLIIDEVVDDPLLPPKNAPKRLINSVLPILTVVILTITGIMITGYYNLMDKVDQGAEGVTFDSASIAGAGDSYGALLYASFFTVIECLIMYRIQNIMSFQLGIATVMYGVKDMVETMLILVFAWGVGSCFEDMGVPTFIVSALSGSINPGLIPFLCCILSALMSFTTGTSWGTMTIMLPLAMPLAHAASTDENLMIYTVSAVLSGGIFGDLCSPIAATTILTCTTVKIPVRSHVNSQLPYAAVALIVSLFLGYLPVGFGAYPDWAGLLICIGALVVILFVLGVPTESTCLSRWEFVCWKLFKRAPTSDYGTGSASSVPYPGKREGEDSLEKGVNQDEFVNNNLS
ncbi:hypothetical protein K502DRAFT_315836 [Neoconidiobolus thromboides FSU 785]|nr:hypothetical protein K502DRAFT_315836 [Neoconidiobolus thromboides FSU 785]